MSQGTHEPLRSNARPSMTGLWLLLAVVVAGIAVYMIFVAPFAAQASSSLDQELAAIDARTESYENSFASLYGATDVNYTGNEVTMTVGDKSYKCEAPEKEELEQRPTLRCIPLVHIDAPVPNPAP